MLTTPVDKHTIFVKNAEKEPFGPRKGAPVIKDKNMSNFNFTIYENSQVFEIIFSVCNHLLLLKQKLERDVVTSFKINALTPKSSFEKYGLNSTHVENYEVSDYV